MLTVAKWYSLRVENCFAKSDQQILRSSAKAGEKVPVRNSFDQSPGEIRVGVDECCLVG
jgi:hypothetical protein